MATGRVYVRSAVGDAAQNLYNANQLAALLHALEAVAFGNADGRDKLPKDMGLKDFPLWGFVKNTDADVKAATRWDEGVSGDGNHVKYLPHELDGDGAANKDKAFKRRMLGTRDVASASIATDAASATHYVGAALSLYPDAVGAGTPFRFAGLYCAQTTAPATPQKTPLSAAQAALFPSDEDFNLMFRDGRTDETKALHSAAWWRSHANCRTINIRQNRTDAAIWFLVIFGMSYVAVPDRRLTFRNAGGKDIYAAKAPYSAWRANGKSDLGLSDAGIPAGLHGRFIEHGASCFALGLVYYDVDGDYRWGVVGISEWNVGSGAFENRNEPCYLKSRWDNVDGSGDGVCRLWRKSAGHWLTKVYTAIETSRASFTVEAVGDGRVSFGTTDDAGSVFFGNPARWASGDGAWREVFVPNGATCHMRAIDYADGWFFRAWVVVGETPAVSTERSASAAHDVADGEMRALALFTPGASAANPGESDKTVVVTVGAHCDDDLDAEWNLGGVGVRNGGGESADPGASAFSGGAGVQAYTFADAETAFSLHAWAASPSEGHPGILSAMQVGSHVLTEAERAAVTFGWKEYSLPSAGGVLPVFARFREPVRHTVTYAGAAQPVRNGSGTYAEGVVESEFSPPAGKRLSLAGTTIERRSGGTWADVKEACGARASGDTLRFLFAGGDYRITAAYEETPARMTFGFSAESAGHGAVGEAALRVSYTDADGEEATATGVAGGEAVTVFAKYGTDVTLEVLNVEAESEVARVASAGMADWAMEERESSTPAREFAGTREGVGPAESVTVSLGAGISVSVVVPGVDEPGDGEAGTAVLSVDGAAPVAEAVAPYGATVAFAIAEGDGAYGVFWGLVRGSGFAEAAYVLKKGAPRGVSVVLSAETRGAYYALFRGAGGWRVFVKVANAAGMSAYGNVGIWDMALGAVKYASEAEFLAAMAEESGLPAQAQQGGAARPAALMDASAAGFEPEGSGPEWWSFAPGASAVAVCSPAGADHWFKDFTFRRFADSGGGLAEGEEDAGSAARLPFAAYAQGVLTANYSEPGEVRVYARYEEGAVSVDGSLPDSGSSDGARWWDVRGGAAVALHATPAAGYAFAGWFRTPPGEGRQPGDLVSASPTLRVDTAGASGAVTLWADAARALYRPLVWEGGDASMEMVWRSRRFAAAQPQEFAAAAVEAEGYPVALKVRYASSPDAKEDGDWDEVSIDVDSQDARRLPMARRPERYAEVEVRASSPVLRVAASTSMSGLNG